jgi:hypothetical protein
VRWAEVQIATPGDDGLPAVRFVLERALFVTTLFTPLRERVLVLLGVVLKELDPKAWSLMASRLRAESRRITPEILERKVEDARKELGRAAE